MSEPFKYGMAYTVSRELIYPSPPDPNAPPPTWCSESEWLSHDLVTCQRKYGHKGKHRFTMTWKDER